MIEFSWAVEMLHVPNWWWLGRKWYKFRSVAILRKISCRISWRHCFLDLRNIYWDIRQKSPNLPILVAKSVFLWNSYSRQTLPIWQEQSPLKRLQEDILFVSELLLDPELIVGFISNFLKNFSRNLSLCSVLNSLEEKLYWTLGWIESPRSECFAI